MESILAKTVVNYSPTGGYYNYAEAKGKIPAFAVKFQIVYDGVEEIKDGRVILFMSSSPSEPRLNFDDLHDLLPCFAKDVCDVKPGDIIEFDSREFSQPGSLGFIPASFSCDPDSLYLQALINLDVSDPDANTCTGNYFSLPVQFKWNSHCKHEEIYLFTIKADQKICGDYKQRNSKEWLQNLSIKSDLLSAFHKRDINIFGAVILPRDYMLESNWNKKYPVIYQIEGFTGTERYLERADDFLDSEMGKEWKNGDWPCPMIRVVLGSRCTYGHTSFSDSDVNGPWATALVDEFIPAFEKQYRAIESNSSRFLTGHSSGGWSSLWLQINYPHIFGGTWSSAPDPVDFTKFQIVNIYEADNMYWDDSGRPYPTSRTNGSIDCTVRDENLVERVYARGNGGQWDAFFAVFGPCNEQGCPKPLYNKITGEIDRSVAKSYERFDICLKLKTEKDLLQSLTGKIHVICGQEDNYYLNGAVKSLQKIIGKTSSCGNYVKLVPGDHNTIKTKDFYTTVFNEIASSFMGNCFPGEAA